MTNLSMILMKLEEWSKAEPHLLECLDIFQVRPPRNPDSRLKIQSALGKCLLMMARYEEAERLLTVAYSQSQTDTGNLEQRRLQLLRRLVKLYDSWGKPGKAAEYRALLEEATGGDDSKDEGEEPASDAKTQPAPDPVEVPSSPSDAGGGDAESP